MLFRDSFEDGPEDSEEFMRSGAFERHLNRMRAQYKGNTTC